MCATDSRSIASTGTYSELIIDICRTLEGRYRILLFDKRDGVRRPWGVQKDSLGEAKHQAAVYAHDYEHHYRNRPGGNSDKIARIEWSDT